MSLRSSGLLGLRTAPASSISWQGKDPHRTAKAPPAYPAEAFLSSWRILGHAGSLSRAPQGRHRPLLLHPLLLVGPLLPCPLLLPPPNRSIAAKNYTLRMALTLVSVSIMAFRLGISSSLCNVCIDMLPGQLHMWTLLFGPQPSQYRVFSLQSYNHTLHHARHHDDN